MTALLSVEGLSVHLQGPDGPVPVVDDISYSVDAGTVYGIAGESGSGKTMSVLALMSLLPPGGRVAGSARLTDRDLLTLPRNQLNHVRGRDVAMVFQDPMTSLHPMLTIERQLTEHLRRHRDLSRRAARERAVELLADVRIPDPRGALDAYPHHFSGGMRQRVAIAGALACDPKLLIADEPTTALDVTVQAGIIRLLDDLRRRRRLAVILISHDLGVMSSIADSVAIMYGGRMIEQGSRAEVLQQPRHPYTEALLRALPHPESSRTTPLLSIRGTPPDPAALPSGCAFHPRCRFRVPTCSIEKPRLTPSSGSATRLLACPVDPLVSKR